MNHETEEAKVVVRPICLTPDLLRGVDEQAAREGMFRGRSVIVRRAVKEYLSRQCIDAPLDTKNTAATA